MKSIRSVGTVNDTHFFAVSAPFSAERLPWEDELFDALVFVATTANDSDVETVSRTLVRANTEWIFTAGRRSEYWYDRTDQISVELGRQKCVGDGSPLTAWLEEIQSLDQWNTGYNFGH